MWTARELSNFSRYLETTPRHLWGKPPVLGAFDSARGARDHTTHRRLERRDFGVGGAFDAAPPTQGDPIAFLKFIASKLSAEDWAALQERLCAGEEDEGAEDDQPEFKKNRLPKTALEIAGEDMALATGVGRIKGAGGTPVLTSTRAVVRELGDLAGRIVVGP
jgi:hypothetical protein